MNPFMKQRERVKAREKEILAPTSPVGKWVLRHLSPDQISLVIPYSDTLELLKKSW